MAISKTWVGYEEKASNTVFSWNPVIVECSGERNIWEGEGTWEERNSWWRYSRALARVMIITTPVLLLLLLPTKVSPPVVSTSLHIWQPDCKWAWDTGQVPFAQRQDKDRENWRMNIEEQTEDIQTLLWLYF